MCAIDWNLTAAAISAIASAGTLVVAWVAINTWKVQARGAAVQEIATAAWGLRYAFYNARSPLYLHWEFPQEYWDAGDSRSTSLEADSYEHAFRERLKEIWPYLKSMSEVRAKAGAVLDDEAANAVEHLMQTAHTLKHYMDQRVSQLRAGPEAVALWSDQAHVKKVRESVVAHGSKDDKFSREFEDAFQNLLANLKRRRKSGGD